MGIIMDLIIIAVFVFCVIFYRIKGFASSALSMLRFFISLALSFALSKPLANKLQPLIEGKFADGDGVLSDIGTKVVSSGYISRVLSFAIIFIVTLVAVKLLEIVLSLFLKIPALNFMNKLLGTIMGVAIGLLWMQILSVIFMVLAVYFSGTVSWITAETFDNTILTKFLNDYNIFRLIFEKLVG